jgi:hypothetical protein
MGRRGATIEFLGRLIEWVGSRKSFLERAARLAVLPAGEPTRISVGRYRGEYQYGDYLYPEVVEGGGFLVAGPCTLDEIVRRFGPGDYRITAYGFEPAGLRWECFVSNVKAAVPEAT